MTSRSKRLAMLGLIAAFSSRHTQTYPRTQRHTQTYPRTQRHTQTYPRTQRHTDIPTYPETHTDIPTYPETHRHTHVPRDTHRHTHTPRDTQTYPRTQRHTQTYPRTQRHTDIPTHPETHTDIPTHPETHTDIPTYPETHRHTHVPRDTQTYPRTQRHTDIPTYPETHRHTHAPRDTHRHTHVPRDTQTYPRTQRHTDIPTYPETHTDIPTYPETHRHTHVPRDTQTYPRTQRHTHTHTHLPRDTHIPTYPETHTHTHLPRDTQTYPRTQRHTHIPTYPERHLRWSNFPCETRPIVVTCTVWKSLFDSGTTLADAICIHAPVRRSKGPAAESDSVEVRICDYCHSSRLAWAYKDPHCVDGRHGIVHLFEWKWSDIAAECERFLGPYGFCGVQTSPANENRVVTNPNRPWWERYQPVSYKMTTRSGTEQDFKDMVSRCNAKGVRIYVDVVLNHMTGVGGRGTGTGGTYFDADTLQFPGVPFGPTDFNGDSNCFSSDGNINNYQSAEEIRNCRLVSLLDLKLGKSYVRDKVAEYLNHLVDLGVAGFRSVIVNKVKDVQMGGRPFVVQEVIDMGGEAVTGSEYLSSGRITNFKFGAELARVFRHQNAMKWLNNFDDAWGMWPAGDVVNFIDNHDNQRGHDGAGSVLTNWEPKPYKMASAFMLAWPYGVSRIMSSYNYDRNNKDQGPPHNDDMSIKSVSLGGMSCGDGWICEHRWRQIYNMVAFSNMAANSPVTNWWKGGDYQIAFSRGSRAFMVMNLEGYDINANLMTGLPAGKYCDIIPGNLENGKCTGTTVDVDGSGRANIHVCSNCDDPMVAIHIGAKVGDKPRRF
ncbi:hypothetical protein RRG08_030798 [Elysia crispata]|uniref:alpha-amylase n=1 Tax=Elysia crispata TaxID=231223 RepID=A0AAE1CXT8_9GAST|nr:hypothetical protein RRG08_030798 [Elysia crispata]